MIYLDEEVIARFWIKVDTSGECWVWTASTQRRGYGQLEIKYKPVIASRVSWQIHYGDIPDGLFVLHSCDNPPCVRPEHLFLGTAADNARDMDTKQRRVNVPHYGENHGMAKLTENQVSEIRQRIAAGEMQKDIAADFKISRATVSAINKRRLWRTTSII